MERRRGVADVAVFVGLFGTLFNQIINQSKIYPCCKILVMVTNIGSKSF